MKQKLIFFKKLACPSQHFRRWMILLVSLIFFIPFQIASADEGWQINSFHSNINIKQSGEVKIVETITVDFNTLQKHGIYRDIPYIYQSDNKKTYTEIAVNNVLQNHQTAKYETSRNDGYIRIKIGDPNKTISGKNTYQINYIAKGVLKGFPDHDELYWNVTGNNWPVSISEATATVTLPQGGLTQTTCYEGYSGSTTQCQSKIWLKYGRDYWLSQNQFPKKDDKGKIMPLSTHETTVVEFTPPDNLTPAEIGVLMDERADTHDIVAAIIDLAARGYLTITEIPKKWMFGQTDYKLTKLEQKAGNKNLPKQQLLSYEQILLNKLFTTGDTINISSLKTTFYQELKQIKNALYKEVLSKNLFPENPETIRTKYLVIAILLTLAGIAGTILSIEKEFIPLADISIAAGITGPILLIISRFMPRRTAYGRELYRRAKGYHLFIDKAEKYRQQFFEKENLFNEVLPYAIIFGLTGKFAKAMSDIGLKPASTSWYIGAQPFHTQTFAASINDFNKSVSTAIASSPKSSGFSSGGSSGGGFGGGGGGSW